MGNQPVWGLHLIFLSIFLLAATYTCLGAQNSSVSCHQRERLALLKFKHSVKDDFTVLSSWVGIDCCSWKGVHCDGATRSVVGLHLRGNYKGPSEYNLEQDYYLVGEKVIVDLTVLWNLKHLDLSGNNFHGSKIPEFIGSFKQLSYLNLSNARFNGIIPLHIGNLSNLKVLDLSSYSANQMLWSNDMAWVSGLSSLMHLDLSEVDFSQAKNIDMVLYMIPSLVYLSLRGCRLSNVDLALHFNSSKILPNIEHLDLSSNFFEGQLPHVFQNMTSITFLDLSTNNLTLSWNFVNLLYMIPSLSELHLSRCRLHNAPFSPTYFNFSSHSNIQYLYLSQNLIERFPSELTNMTSLIVLDLSKNNLNSLIPVIPNLLKLDVSYNNLEHIELVGIWRQCHLKELFISRNYFTEEMIGPSTNTSDCSQYALETLHSNGNNLKGLIPESLERLTNLRVLHLMSNSFSGPIPKALERLRSLEVLDLAYNDLTGPIPTFAGKLTKLYLSENRFSGPIPESLGRLTGLTDLFLRSNKLTGPILVSIGKLSSLQAFSLSSNLLNGTIPVSIGQLTKLAYLDVSINSLEGVVTETHFANLPMLKYLYTTSNHKLIFNISHKWIPPFHLRGVGFGSCNIGDGFPQWMETQRKLEKLVLSNTSLYGQLPTWLQKMPEIYYLDLSHNKLSGSLINLPIRNPINEFEVESSKFLLLQDNHFNGSIPRSLCKRTNLVLLDISKNRLSGNIPECVGNLQHMVMLILSSNDMSGVLPRSLGNISSLEWLQLNDNGFTSELPQDFENLRFLKVLDLGHNKFFGNIPKWIGKKLSTLRVLRLHKNNFTGRIPQSLCECSDLHILDIAHNHLTGSIPHCFEELSGMIGARQQEILKKSSSYEIVIQTMNVNQVIKGVNLEYTKTMNLVFNMDLSSNKLTGAIPQEITALTLLMGLNMSHNHLSGSIPHNIGNMKALSSLDFSDNQLTGIIPPTMADLNFLSYMNLSHNNLLGRIPTGNQLQTLTNPSIYAGNKDLCGAPLPNNCPNPENQPTATSNENYKDNDESNNLWFCVGVICGFATGFWGIVAVTAFKKHWIQKLFTIVEVTLVYAYVALVITVSNTKKGQRIDF